MLLIVLLVCQLGLAICKKISLSNVNLPVDTDGHSLLTGEADVLRLANGTYLLYMNNFGGCAGRDCCNTTGGCMSCCFRKSENNNRSWPFLRSRRPKITPPSETHLQATTPCFASLAGQWRGSMESTGDREITIVANGPVVNGVARYTASAAGHWQNQPLVAFANDTLASNKFFQVS